MKSELNAKTLKDLCYRIDHRYKEGVEAYNLHKQSFIDGKLSDVDFIEYAITLEYGRDAVGYIINRIKLDNPIYPTKLLEYIG